MSQNLSSAAVVIGTLRVKIVIIFQRRKITKPKAEQKEKEPDAAEERRSKIVKRAALEFHDGLYGILYYTSLMS